MTPRSFAALPIPTVRHTLRTALAGAVAWGVLAPSHPLQAQTPRGDAVVEIEGLAVSVASRLRGEGPARAITVLDRATLLELPVTTVAEALDWAAGVDLQPRSAAQADVAVRGGTAEQVLVLVDGVPMSDAQTGHFDLDLAIPLADVERIEVLRGAASAVHGADAVGGVINVVTRPPGGAPSGTVEVEGGTFGRIAGGMRMNGRLGGWSVAASARLDRSDGHRAGTDHDLRLGHLAVAGGLAGGVASLRLGVAARDFGADGFYAPFPSYEETRTRTAAARWARAVGTVSLEVAAHARQHEDDFVLRRGDPAFYQNIHTSLQTGLDVTLRAAPGVWVWAAGATGGRDDLESTNLGDRAADRGAVFGEVGWNGSAARVQGGLRLDAREGFAPAWAPSVSASFTPAANVGVRASVARSFRAPTWTDRFYEDPANRGDPDLAVETAWSSELGMDWTTAVGVRLRATGFLREARDLIDYARPADGPDDAVWQTRNVASASFRGLELEVDGIAVGPAAVDGSLELLDLASDDAGDFISKYALRPLTRTALLGVRVPFGDAVSLGLRVANRRRTDEADRTTADLRLEARVGSSRLWVDATNLGDATWLDVSGLPAPGRALRTGVSMAFGGG